MRLNSIFGVVAFLVALAYGVEDRARLYMPGHAEVDAINITELACGRGYTGFQKHDKDVLLRLNRVITGFGRLNSVWVSPDCRCNFWSHPSCDWRKGYYLETRAIEADFPHPIACFKCWVERNHPRVEPDTADAANNTNNIEPAPNHDVDTCGQGYTHKDGEGSKVALHTHFEQTASELLSTRLEPACHCTFWRNTDPKSESVFLEGGWVGNLKFPARSYQCYYEPHARTIDSLEARANGKEESAVKGCAQGHTQSNLGGDLIKLANDNQFHADGQMLSVSIWPSCKCELYSEVAYGPNGELSCDQSRSEQLTIRGPFISNVDFEVLCYKCWRYKKSHPEAQVLDSIKTRIADADELVNVISERGADSIFPTNVCGTAHGELNQGGALVQLRSDNMWYNYGSFYRSTMIFSFCDCEYGSDLNCGGSAHVQFIHGKYYGNLEHPSLCMRCRFNKGQAGLNSDTTAKIESRATNGREIRAEDGGIFDTNPVTSGHSYPTCAIAATGTTEKDPGKFFLLSCDNSKHTKFVEVYGPINMVKVEKHVVCEFFSTKDYGTRYDDWKFVAKGAYKDRLEFSAIQYRCNKT